MARCDCGAFDCNVCRPGVMSRLGCEDCARTVPQCYYEDRDWGMFGGRDFCPDCLKKKQVGLKEGIEEVLNKFVMLKQLTLSSLVWTNDEGTCLTIVISCTMALSIELLLDALEAIRLLCDGHNIVVAVSTEKVGAEHVGTRGTLKPRITRGVK